ncbi:MAG: hypothetical protein KC591_15825 [Gemmatimonadetes bacterium]|nr:hypothetical protein [Gemmatimonadota bacterium]
MKQARPVLLGAVIFLAGALGARPATANVTIVSQTRTVQANASSVDGSNGQNDSDSASAAAPDDGPFVQGAGAFAFVDNGSAGGAANQNSTLSADQFVATGNCGMDAYGGSNSVFSSVSATSLFDVTFTVSVESTYTLTGFMNGYDSGHSDISLSGPGGSLFQEFAGGNLQIDFDELGTLVPGEYRIRASSSGSVAVGLGKNYASGDFSLTLTVAKPVSVESTSWASVKAAHR